MKLKLSLRSLRYLWHRMLNLKTTRLDGMVILCDPKQVDRSAAREIIKGRYELAERNLARAAIRPGDRVLEIGTGLGVVSVLCNKLAGAGNVTSYEANPVLANAIYKNFSLNDISPHLILKAVTVDGQSITFYQNANVVSSSIYDRGLEATAISVESDPINAAIAERNATVLVMDVEGAEVDLLQNADLTGVRDILVEVHPHIVGAAAIDAMISTLKQSGFVEKERRHKTVWLGRI